MLLRDYTNQWEARCLLC